MKYALFLKALLLTTLACYLVGCKPIAKAIAKSVDNFFSGARHVPISTPKPEVPPGRFMPDAPSVPPKPEVPPSRFMPDAPSGPTKPDPTTLAQGVPTNSFSVAEQQLREAIPALANLLDNTRISAVDRLKIAHAWNTERREAWKRFPLQQPPSQEIFQRKFYELQRLNQQVAAMPGAQISPEQVFERAWRAAVHATNPKRCIRTASVLDVIPDAQTFAATFKRAPSGADLAHLRAAEDPLHSLGTQRLPRASLTRAAVIEAVRSDLPNGVLILLGHSVDSSAGRNLMLPSGEHVAFSEIHAVAAEAGHNCLILTCFSPDLTLASEIAMTEAITLAKKAVSTTSFPASNPDSGIDIADLASTLSSELATRRYQRTITSYAVGGTAVSGITYAAIDRK